MANLRQRIGKVTAWNDNRIIHSNTKIAKINQFYCQRCKRSGSDDPQGVCYCKKRQTGSGACRCTKGCDRK